MTWARGITAIRHASLQGTPASINRETGVMYVDPRHKLSEDKWYFIMLHELGHLKEKTTDEMKADEYAHRQYLREGRSPKQSVYALTDLLNFNKAEDLQRVRQQLRRAQIKDGKPVSNFSGACHHSDYNNLHKMYGWSRYDQGYNEYFLGKFGSWLENKALPAVGKVAGTLLGGGQAAGDGGVAALLAAQEQERKESEARRQQTMMIVVVVGVALVLGVIGFLALRK